MISLLRVRSQDLLLVQLLFRGEAVQDGFSFLDLLLGGQTSRVLLLRRESSKFLLLRCQFSRILLPLDGETQGVFL